ncbi:DNA cytosine methyltransferase [Herbaspirillum sp. HC18]|nr:DNA cytosine methyltransferase [Herbaspirillum sp. HC18]
MNKIPVIDLFSGAGGMSCGFNTNQNFLIIGAADAELGKPSSRTASLECNATYFQNIRVKPHRVDLFDVAANDLADVFSVAKSFEGVLIACPPCTDFSRAKPANHSSDGSRNKLTSRLTDILKRFRPKYFVYENAREALDGPNKHHLEAVIKHLDQSGYSYKAEVIDFSNFGLPQRRERVIILASRAKQVRYLNDLWRDYGLSPGTTTVRQALSRIAELRVQHNSVYDARYPTLTAPVLKRIEAIPQDGGSWTDITETHLHLLIPSMRQKVIAGNLGSYPDVYGRMHLDRPAPTIKRECGHVGNGRYVHPTEHRLLNVSEMAMLQGFPITYQFKASNLANCYRQIGDAVPPFISFQLAALVQWMESDTRPIPSEFVLPSTVVSPAHVIQKTFSSNEDSSSLQKLELVS